ncbi:MAG: hypothetical protein HYX89_03405 [Chloroflexi bacterium]|nr:hypothetical protein [Chloroflexota bacterium]
MLNPAIRHRLNWAIATIALAGASFIGFILWYDSLPRSQKFTILFGSSMRPTLNWFYVVTTRPPDTVNRGDIIQAYRQMHRAVAMPGETVEVRQGVIYISSGNQQRALEEPYVVHQYLDWDWPAITLTGDEYATLGDDRTDPASRLLMVVKRDHVTGVFDRVLFPPGR